MTLIVLNRLCFESRDLVMIGLRGTRVAALTGSALYNSLMYYYNPKKADLCYRVDKRIKEILADVEAVFSQPSRVVGIADQYRT